MKKDYLPRSDFGLKTWTGVLADVVARSPARFGVRPEQAADYAEVQAEYVRRYDANQGNEANRITRVEKDAARRPLVADTRRLVRIIRAAELPDATLATVGLLPPDRPAAPTAANLPRPWLTVGSNNDGTLVVRVVAKRRPAGAVGVAVFTHVGDLPPTRVEQWSFRGCSKKLTRRIGMHADVPDLAKIWVTAAWLDRHLDLGPTADPKTTHLLPGVRIAA